MQSTQTHSWYARLLGFLCGASLLWPWVPHFASTSDNARPADEAPHPARIIPSQQLWQTHTKQEASTPLQLWGFGAQGLLPTSATPHGQLPSMPTLYGWAILDRSHEVMTVHAQGLPAAQAFDVWLIERHPHSSDPALPELGTATIFLGSIHSSTGAATLYATLNQGLLNRLLLDALLVLSPQGADPLHGGFFFAPITGTSSFDVDGQCPLAS